MFCNIPEIDIRNIPNSIDNVEEYIEDELGINTNEVAWQCYDEPQVKVIVC